MPKPGKRRGPKVGKPSKPDVFGPTKKKKPPKKRKKPKKGY